MFRRTLRYGRFSTPGALVLLAWATVGSTLAAPLATAQSFSQILDLGGNIGPRLTRTVTLDRISSPLVAMMYDQASWIDATGSSPLVFTFATDPIWSKIVFSRRDSWLRGFNDWSAPDPLIAPRALDVSGSRKVFVTDPPTQRVLVLSLDEAQKRLSRVGSFSAGLTFPVDVAWDGGTAPLSNDSAVYVLDGAAPMLSYWTKSGSTWNRSWSYGQLGSGTGQFSGPTDVCVRHWASSPDGTSQFGTDFYVVDAGNRRVVWLNREGASAAWRGTVSNFEGWLPVSCTVDHFGIVYVADKQNHRIVSYNWHLEELTRYGSYGTGATNYNTFAYPQDVHIPFGKKVVGGQTIWYGDGRILTAEHWGAGSGGLEHWLGVEIRNAMAVGTAWGPQIQYGTTGMAYHTISVYSGSHRSGEPWVATVANGWLLSPGWMSQLWDGYDSQGQYAPLGRYHFHVSASSAYGCQGQAWCQPSAWTEPVSWNGPPAGCECEWPELCVPCEDLNVALPLDGDPTVTAGLPTKYRLGQVLTSYAGPLLRMEGLGGAGASGARSGAEAVASVRAHGIRALAVDVPGTSPRTPVTIRLYSLTGRLVRILVDETAEPGSYVVGWDGRDDGGRPVQPGVYVAVMTAGTYRGVQRLLLK